MGSEDPMARDQLGSKYLLADPIGRGAMGVVYDAASTDGQVLAVKILRPELSTDAKTVSRFIQERDIFRRIDHPNVVRVHDLVVEGDRLGIIMEKVAGGDLRARIETSAIDPAQSVRIALAIAEGLSAIHAANVIHRDLKPANILLVDDGNGNVTPKISDFGVSRLVSDAMTRTSTTIGTPLYMAPEAADQRGAGPATDVYALGAILFEMLIGAPPFHQGGTFAVLRAHADDPPPRVDGVPEPLTNLIDAMLAKDPAARPGLDSISKTLGDVLATAVQQLTPTIAAQPGSAPAISTAPSVVAPVAEPTDPVGPAAPSVTNSSTAETIVTGAAFAATDAPPSAEAWPEIPEPIGAVGPAPAPGSAPIVGEAPTPGQAPAFGLENESPPFMAGRAATTTRGLDRVSRRTIEFGAVIASLAAVALLTFFLVGRDGNGSTNTGEETVAAEDPASPLGDQAGDSSDDDGALGQFDDNGDGSGDDKTEPSDSGEVGQDSDNNSASDDDGSGQDDSAGDDDGSGSGDDADSGDEATTTTTEDEQTTTTEAPTTTEDVTTTTEEVTTTTEDEPLTPLTLSGFRATNITETSVRIVWQSSHCAISQITFNGDVFTDTGWPKASTPCWLTHGRNYTNLDPGTTYTVSVKVADQEGRLANAGPITFTTN